MKKAFTLSESVITIAVIGIIGAIAIPFIISSRPNKDQIVYNKASYALQSAITVAMDSTFAVTRSDSTFWQPAQKEAFCKAVAQNLNTTKINCSIAGSYANPNIETMDGIKFWGLGPRVKNELFGDNIIVHIDRNMTDGERKRYTNIRENGIAEGLLIKVSADGKVYLPYDAEANEDKILYNVVYTYENELIEDAMSKVKTEAVGKDNAGGEK